MKRLRHKFLVITTFASLLAMEWNPLDALHVRRKYRSLSSTVGDLKTLLFHLRCWGRIAGADGYGYLRHPFKTTFEDGSWPPTSLGARMQTHR